MLLLPPRSTLFPYTTLFRSTGDLGLEGRVRLQAAQHRLVGLVELGDELGGDHAASPRCRRSGSSWVSVSLVTTRRQRACSGWVARASAWVVKPSTGTPGAASSAAKMAS